MFVHMKPEPRRAKPTSLLPPCLTSVRRRTQVAGGPINAGGFLAIDESKLGALSDAQVLELHKSRYVLAQGTRPDGSTVHAAIYVVDPVDTKNGGVYLELVESRKMETGKVSADLSAEAMAKSIASEGKVAIHGVYFDTGKFDVKPQSTQALDEMAKLLKSQPQLKVYIVGHTDSQGGLASNTELSQRRAEMVAKALEANYKIDAKRLLPKGVASLVPVASNDGEPGREKNRRVELVKQ